MNLFVTITVTTIVILMVFDQTPITIEARRLRKADGQDHFKAGSTDDFVSTMGHKNGNVNVEGFQDDFKPTERRQLQKTNSQKYFKAGSTDDFAPTSPGNSPGMGHKKGDANVEEVKYDFKPIKEERMLQKTNDQNHFKITGSKDDFAPTSPGNSPGIGHKKGDDFKPTTPGHSPGIGHAIKNNEPKA